MLMQFVVLQMRIYMTLTASFSRSATKFCVARFVMSSINWSSAEKLICTKDLRNQKSMALSAPMGN